MTSAGPETAERAEARLEEALSERAVEDPRPEYRRLLAALREKDAAVYEEAVRRYEEEFLPAVAGGGTDVLSAWMRYGLWLARRLGAGRTMAVDATGRAEPIEDDDPEVAPDLASSDAVLVLHLPEDDPRTGIVLRAPAEPTDPQAVTRELLCG